MLVEKDSIFMFWLNQNMWLWIHGLICLNWCK